MTTRINAVIEINLSLNILLGKMEINKSELATDSEMVSFIMINMTYRRMVNCHFIVRHRILMHNI